MITDDYMITVRHTFDNSHSNNFNCEENTTVQKKRFKNFLKFFK